LRARSSGYGSQFGDEGEVLDLLVQGRRDKSETALFRRALHFRIDAMGVLARIGTEERDDARLLKLEGHCGLPTDQLIPLAEELLEAPRDLILTALELERSDGAVIADKVGDTACTFLAGLYRAEQAIADRLIRIVSGRLPWPWIDEEKAMPWIEKRSGLQLADSQRAAIRLALMAKALVITGGPGVGKTTIVNSILKILAAKGVRLLLCAPTGRATKRMTEATGRRGEDDPSAPGGRSQNWWVTRNANNPLECDLLVVDEASMVDVLLMQALVKAIPDHAALLIVGDIDQLPPVGPGQVLAASSDRASCRSCG
jgi:exodeoxyribonuclease V alpha subunit